MPATASPKSEGASPRREAADLALRWSGRVSLTRRILAVNIFALALVAGGFFYLDSFRTRIIDERLVRMGREEALMGNAIAPTIARIRLDETLKVLSLR